MAEHSTSPSPLIFDRKLVRARRRRAARSGRRHFCSIASPPIWPSGWRRCCGVSICALDLGTPGEAVRAALGAHRHGRHLRSPPTRPRRRRERAVACRRRRGGACRFATPRSISSVSALALQFVNDLPGTLVQIRRALKPDGLFLAALLGGETLTELRQSFAAAESEIEGGVSPRVAPFADLRDLGGLLQRAGFALPVTDTDRVTVRYDSAFALDARSAAHGRDQRADRAPPRAAQARDADAHGARSTAERFADADGRVRATFEIVWLSGWAPHREPAAAAQARLGESAARRRARHAGDLDG